MNNANAGSASTFFRLTGSLHGESEPIQTWNPCGPNEDSDTKRRFSIICDAVVQH